MPLLKKLLLTALFSILVGFASSAEVWVSPENPDPRKILDEADADRSAGRYEEALAKHLWFHENALKYRPSLSGVRVSFALGDWYKLAKVYPPAMKELEALRKRSYQTVMDSLENEFDSSALSIFANINRILDLDKETVDLFKIIVEKDFSLADRAYLRVKPALLREKEYTLYAEYINPEVELSSQIHMYRMKMSHAKREGYGQELTDIQNKRLIKSVSTIVAILAANNRKEEATDIAEEAESLIKDEETLEALSKALDSALEGKVPDPDE